VHASDEYVFIMRPIENHDSALGGSASVYAPEEVMVGLDLRRLFEIGDSNALGIESAGTDV
jgi:hypothetical protein